MLRIGKPLTFCPVCKDCVIREGEECQACQAAEEEPAFLCVQCSQAGTRVSVPKLGQVCEKCYREQADARDMVRGRYSEVPAQQIAQDTFFAAVMVLALIASASGMIGLALYVAHGFQAALGAL